MPPDMASKMEWESCDFIREIVPQKSRARDRVRFSSFMEVVRRHVSYSGNWRLRAPSLVNVDGVAEFSFFLEQPPFTFGDVSHSYFFFCEPARSFLAAAVAFRMAPPTLVPKAFVGIGGLLTELSVAVGVPESFFVVNS